MACISSLSMAQGTNIQAAFTHKQKDISVLWLFMDGYCSATKFKNNEYLATMGGPYTYTNEKGLVLWVEYSDEDPEQINTTIETNLFYDGNGIVEDGKQVLEKVTPLQQDLDGLWRMTGRITDGKTIDMPRGNRKTIKILVGGYFQWIAINPAEKGFYGTGGGKYSFIDGKYTEEILFFSRDNSRVGAKLSFNGELKNGNWHHSGNSSKGDPIHEIWSRVNK